MREEDIQHVYPAGDDGEHLLHCLYIETDRPVCLCPCKPRHQETEQGGLIVIHDAYDGRLGVEWANEILK
jgi:hypothetical protein